MRALGTLDYKFTNYHGGISALGSWGHLVEVVEKLRKFTDAQCMQYLLKLAEDHGCMPVGVYGAGR